jgi:hypothetical protein
LRRSSLYTCGIICLTHGPLPLLVNEPRHEVGEPQQITDPKQRATLAEDDLRIECDDVGPLPRDRANVIRVDAQQEPRPVPVVPLAYADELSSAQRVEGMGHAHKGRARVRRACSSC